MRSGRGNSFERCRGFHQPFQAESDRADIEANAGTENRVGQNREAVHRKHDRAVADPRGV